MAETGALDKAWRFQLKALAQDPWGAETLHNTGLLAHARGDLDMAMAILKFNRIQFPFYQPSEEKLKEWNTEVVEQQGPELEHGELLDLIKSNNK